MNSFITKCDISDIMTETTRFLFHMALVHISTHIIDGKDELFGENIVKMMIVTAIAIIIYHVVIKKIVGAKLKNIQSTCISNKDKDKK